MADCLSVLREYRMTKKPIKVDDDMIVFGDKQWPKNTKTNYIRYDTSGQVEYYTLYSLVDFLENKLKPHPTYVKEATNRQIPVVRLPDRKDLESYLEGITSSSLRIDRSAPLEFAIPRGSNKRPSAVSESAAVIEAKKAKVQENQVKPASATKDNEDSSAPISSLTEAISLEKLKELKEKRKKVINKTTKPVVSDDFIPPANLVENRLGLDPEEAIKYITSKERVWRTRSTILQSLGSKPLAKNVSAVLNSVKALEGGGSSKQEAKSEPEVKDVKQPQPTHYNRYDQEKFKSKEDTEGFKIDTMGTYHGLSLKSVTHGAAPKVPTPVAQPSPAARQPAAPQKRVSKTPIIILPGGTSCVITLLNARDILQDLRFISSEQKKAEGVRRDAELLIHRTKTVNGQQLSIPYRVVDMPSKLSMEEWERVVACFVQGPAWQFKGWPWLLPDGSPTEIFRKLRAFHLKWDDLPLEKNVGKWDVHVLMINKSKRHLDRSIFLKFWETLDKWVTKNKPALRT